MSFGVRCDVHSTHAASRRRAVTTSSPDTFGFERSTLYFWLRA